MRVELPDIIAPAKFLLDASQTMNDEEYFEFCANNQDLRIERTSQGEIVMMPPCGGESDSRNTELVMQLAVWAKRDGRGRAFGPSVEFILPPAPPIRPTRPGSLASDCPNSRRNNYAAFRRSAPSLSWK